jgi:hypothetical protein
MNTAVRSYLEEISPRSYAIPLEPAVPLLVTYAWPSSIDEALAEDIVHLMRQTTEAAPFIGFDTTIDDEQANRYIEELKANLASGKCHLLAISANNDGLIAKCVLRRNLNPNNRHIADLCKGMISEKYRGGLVLAAAFVEISRRCDMEGIDLLTLDVRAGTHAQRAWERFGFRTYGLLEDYARVAGQSIAGRFMAQSVANLRAAALDILANANVRSITDDANE